MSLKHMREAWGITNNPFPPAAIGGEDSSTAPYNDTILAEDHDLFLEKLIIKAALPPGREFGYLWSQGKRDDTGFGKTTLMRKVSRELNADLGKSLVDQFSLPKTLTMAAIWSSMTTTGVTGIYALLFNVLTEAAKRPDAGEPSLLEKCWERIADASGKKITDPDFAMEVSRRITDVHGKLFPGYPALREDVVQALTSADNKTVLSSLSEVTQAARARNGLAYFDALYCVLRAADVEHFFVFIDQLEDLATAKNVARATRQREVGRFRDIFAETAGFRGHCHAVFTFHNRAALALADFWQQERLNPPFWPQDPMGRPAIVVLKGLASTTQVEALLATYLDSVRDVPTGTAEPFEPSAFQPLLDRCEGRIGHLLAEAYAVLDQAAEASLPSIPGSFITNSLPGVPDAESEGEASSDQDTLEALWNTKS